MAKITTAMEGFHVKIKSLYDIEKALEVALPKMAAASTDTELAEGFLMHLKETQYQSKRLEQIFEMLGENPQKHVKQAIKGLVADGEEIIALDAPDALRDVMLAGAGREVEHYEMACYMGAIAEAKALGLDDAVDLLKETLKEEEAADKILMKACKEALEEVESEEEAA